LHQEGPHLAREGVDEDAQGDQLGGASRKADALMAKLPQRELPLVGSDGKISLEWYATLQLLVRELGSVSGGGVSSFEGRSGVVAGAAGDYTAGEITNVPAGNIAAVTVQAALAELDSEKLASASYTAADVLAKLLTVDGAASGLDADLLDGISSAGFYQPGGTDVAVADGGTGASTAGGAATNLGLGTGDSPQFTAVNIGAATDTTVSRDSPGIIAVESVPLYSQIPQNSKSAAYTTVLADAQKHILHPAADNNARTFTIDSNTNVAYPIGTCITFINQINTVTIAITSDTLTLAGTGATGSRTLAANGIATALKVASTSWVISGTGLS
jgi:hypothetical protein